jgi:hypothetical protein
MEHEPTGGEALRNAVNAITSGLCADARRQSVPSTEIESIDAVHAALAGLPTHWLTSLVKLIRWEKLSPPVVQSFFPLNPEKE